VQRIAELAGQALPGGLPESEQPSVLSALAWIMALQNVVLLVAGLALALWRCPPPPRRTAWPKTVAWGLLSGIAAFALSGAIAFVQERAGIPVREQEPLLEALRQIPFAAAFPWVAVVAPVGEEVFFRGYLFRFLASRSPMWLAHAASALAFAGIHLNPSGLLVYVAIAVVLATAYRRTGSLLVPILGHAVHNAITLLAVYAS
jgi:membrane protease YdiL (CAAX protease family)